MASAGTDTASAGMAAGVVVTLEGAIAPAPRSSRTISRVTSTVPTRKAAAMSQSPAKLRRVRVASMEVPSGIVRLWRRNLDSRPAAAACQDNRYILGGYGDGDARDRRDADNRREGQNGAAGGDRKRDRGALLLLSPGDRHRRILSRLHR